MDLMTAANNNTITHFKSGEKLEVTIGDNLVNSHNALPQGQIQTEETKQLLEINSHSAITGYDKGMPLSPQELQGYT